MLRINELYINIELKDGRRTFHDTFTEGVNIITSSINTSGKSAIINSIIYCLGIEELIGGKRGHKALSSAFHNKIWDEAGDDSKQHDTYSVLYSTIYLEITNGDEIVTLKRHADHPNISDSLVTVYFSPYAEIGDDLTKVEDFYVNSQGAARNTKGLFTFLQNFLSLDFPLVPKYKGDPSKLYLQNIFGAFFIEQKRGWSDILARVPNYGIIDVKQRVVEFLLSLDTMENEANKSKIKKRIEKINLDWKTLYIEFTNKISPFYISNLEPNAMVIGEDLIENKIIKLIKRNDNESQETIDSYIENQIIKKTKLNNDIYEKNNDIHLLEKEKEKVLEEISIINSKIDKLRSKIRHIETEVLEYEKSRSVIYEDIQNNKDLNKLKSLGANEQIKVFENVCPVCHQGINDSLIDSQQDIQVMSIEENISYLTQQLKLFDNMIKQKKEIKENIEVNLLLLRKRVTTLSSLVKAFNNDIYNVSESYSEASIEKKIRLKLEIDDKEKIKEEFHSVLSRFINLSNDLKVEMDKLKDLPKERLSESDNKKLTFFSDYFVRKLRKFDYRSVSNLSEISISKDTYMPEANGFDLKSDSSASDNIRTIWAYTLGLMKTSDKYSGNHLGIVIFDEPKQHSIHEKDMIQFFDEVIGFRNNQIIIGFTQDQLESPQDFFDTLKQRGCNIIDLGTKAFK